MRHNCISIFLFFGKFCVAAIGDTLNAGRVFGWGRAFFIKTIAKLPCVCYNASAQQLNTHDMQVQFGNLYLSFPYIVKSCWATIGGTFAGRVFG